jgi:hypothetical protein
MADITNVFVAGRMDKDLDERLIQEGVYRNALNIDVDTDENSNIGSARNSLGNTIKTDLAALFGVESLSVKTIGAVTYDADNLIYWIITGDYDAVIEYNAVTGITTRVLACTNNTLNFNQNYIITGINYINGFLYWTDDLNPPRKINISRAKGYAIDDARIADDISVIMAPPLNPPTLRLFNDTLTQTNNISEKFLSFSYRYKYIDGQYSAMSPLSAVSFSPKAYTIDYNSGHNKSMTNKFNTVDITFNTGSRNVTDIQVLMHDEMSSNISIVETFNKKKLNLSNGVHKTLTFNNNKTYTILTSDQLTRTFDNVPLHAKAQDYVGSRLMYGNYTQFYNIVNKTNDPINIKINLSSTFESVSPEAPKSTFRSDRDYEIAIEYLDNYGRHTTALTSAYFTNANTTNTSNNTVYIPATQSDTANSLIASVYNEPPVWASSYRLLIKQNKKEYYNIFPIYFYEDGSYRYFLINESDRDKFTVGGYVIFKSTSTGPTYSNKQYKILELKNQPANFLTSGTTIERAGLYFKIKVDSASEISTFNGISIFWQDSYGNAAGIESIFYPESSIDNPIYYGSNGITQNSFYITPLTDIITNIFDLRYTIKAISSTEYKYTTNINENFNSNVYAIVLNVPQIIYNGTVALFSITWTSFPVADDKWKVNIRSNIGTLSTVNTSGVLITSGSTNIFGGQNTPTNGRVILNPDINLTADFNILNEDIITINLTSVQSQIFYVTQDYINLEEWFIESGAYLNFISYDYTGANIGNKAVCFRRGDNFSTEENNGFYTSILYNTNTAPYRNTNPLYMIIKGTDQDKEPGAIDRISGDITINRLDNTVICETVAKESPLDLYHETAHTYPIVDGKHVVVWSYLDYTAPTYASGNTNLGQLIPGSAITSSDMEHWFTVGDTVYVLWNNNPIDALTGMYTITYIPDAYNIVIDLPFPGIGAATPGKVSFSSVDVNQLNFISQPAVIKINNPNTYNSTFNGWCFGNGLESDRIYDDFNATELQYSPRVNAIVDDYKERDSFNAICYSGIYGQNTGIDRLNEFNLSIANFKYLHSEFGSIQKIYARDTDLLVFQENKVSQVKYEKNLLYDAVGGSQVASIPQVLGTQVAYPGDYGISNNPESFAEWGNDVYWTDARRGAVLLMGSYETKGNQIEPISSIGMTGYFRNSMMSSPNTQKLGGYDPHTRKYVLAANETSIISCDTLSLSRYSLSVPKTVALEELFTIIYSSSWTISKVDNGSGTSWLTITTPVGSGSQDIYGLVQANTGATRYMKVRVTYCSGIYKDFILTQASGKRIKLIVLVSNNSTAIQ